ncbi:flavin reductase family protein [Promicromonospora sp. MS192]|uniref:flavin reductase family protein n=1 Tax=Promicromonospora sp. MS192 TaxID=3412684 RepID=UPI003C2FFA40
MSSTSRGGSVADGFRDAMAGLASGVCVVTTTAGGVPAGLTTTAVMSVSLDPPLVAVGVGRTSRTLAPLRAARRFAVHVLAHDREDVAAVFASKAPDKFIGRVVGAGRAGVPLLTEDARHVLECETWTEVEAGDHVLLVGRVVAVHASARDGGRALVHFDRAFHQVGAADGRA